MMSPPIGLPPIAGMAEAVVNATGAVVFLAGLLSCSFGFLEGSMKRGIAGLLGVFIGPGILHYGWDLISSLGGSANLDGQVVLYSMLRGVWVLGSVSAVLLAIRVAIWSYGFGQRKREETKRPWVPTPTIKPARTGNGPAARFGGFGTVQFHGSRYQHPATRGKS